MVDAALEPGVSIAGLALAHGVNANQLRNWVALRRRRQTSEKELTVLPNSAPPAFVPAVAASAIALPSARPISPRVRLRASLPNGVRLELEDADAEALSVMIEALGRCDVPAG